mgnify:CR=1 FL=1
MLIDDRLLIDEILVGLPGRRPTGPLSTTSYWYYRACRASVAGGAGHLSGPFAALPLGQRGDAIHRLLALPDHIDLPEPRQLVPVMAELARRHDRLNLLNLEAVAAASIADATVWLSSPAAAGVLPAVLESEGIRWREVRLPA